MRGGGGCRGIRVDFSVFDELIDELVASIGRRGGGAEPTPDDDCGPLLADVCEELGDSVFTVSLF